MLAQHSEIQVQHLCKAAPSVESDVINAMLPCTAEDGGHWDSNLASSLTWPHAVAATQRRDTWNHRLSQCKYWTAQFLFALELPKVAFLQLQFAIRHSSQSRFTIFVAADPAILAGLGDHLLHHGVFSVAQMFYRLRTSTSMFLTEFVALFGTKQPSEANYKHKKVRLFHLWGFSTSPIPLGNLEC